MPSTAYGKENPFGLDAVCVNMKCVRGKKRAVTNAKSKEGKEGIEREKAQMEAAAKEIATRGTMNIGKVECLLLLHSLATGYVYAGTGMVYWQDTLAASLDLGRIGRGNVVDENLKKVLEEKSEEELRYLVSLMLFERMRDQNKPQDWKPLLEPVFDLLGVENVLSAGDIEMAEAIEAAPTD